MLAAVASALLLQAPAAPPKPGVLVRLFVMADCPLSRKYAPEMARIGRDFEPKGVRFELVHVDPNANYIVAKMFAREFRLTFVPKLDPNHALANQAGVKVVPSAAVFDRKGQLRYSGRIDDQYAELGVRRPKPTRRDLRLALDEVLADKKVSRPRTEAVGCSLPRPARA